MTCNWKFGVVFRALLSLKDTAAAAEASTVGSKAVNCQKLDKSMQGLVADRTADMDQRWRADAGC